MKPDTIEEWHGAKLLFEKMVAEEFPKDIDTDDSVVVTVVVGVDDDDDVIMIMLTLLSNNNISCWSLWV